MSKVSPAGVGGAVGLAVFAGASTYAIGRTFLKHLEQGLELSKIDPANAKEQYNELLEEGKAIVQEQIAQHAKR